MLETKLTVVSEKIRKAYNSKWAILINLSFFFVLFLLQSILVYFLIIQPPTNQKSGESYWWLIIIETLGAIFGLTANIFTIRVNKNFFYFNTFALICWTINSLMLGLWVDNIKIVLLYIPIIIRFSRWRTGEHHKITPRRILPVLVLPILFLLTFFSLVFAFYIFKDFDSFFILDSFNLIFGIAQALMVAYGIIEGLFFVFPVSICLLWINFASGNYIGFITCFIMFINMSANIMAWLALYHHEHQTFKYQKIEKVSPLLKNITTKYL